MNKEELTDFFYEWFTDSYPRVKPSSHTVDSHVAFATEVMKHFLVANEDFMGED
jgi:hypothetical protein